MYNIIKCLNVNLSASFDLVDTKIPLIFEPFLRNLFSIARTMLSSSTIVLAILSLIICVSADRLLDPMKVAKQQGSVAPPPCKLCRDTVKSFKAVNQTFCE